MSLDCILDCSEYRQIKTPYYCFDTNIFIERVMCLKKKLGNRIKICYSLKANPWLVSTAYKVCDYIEVCSKGELQICIDSGVPLDKLSVGGICKSEIDCKQLAEAPPYRISVESPTQFYMIKNYSEIYNKKVDILLRLTSGNQFGMSVETAAELIKLSDESMNIQVRGIHYYPGTQNKGNLTAEKHLDLIKKAAEILKIDEIEFGPGFGAALFQNQNSIEYDAYIDSVSEQLFKLSEKYRVVVECGRYLTYSAGTYTTTIIDIKEQNGRCFIIVDGGIHQISYYGQINGKPCPIVFNIDNTDNNFKCCTICGSLCTANDILAKDIEIPEPNIGDRLLFKNVGAYSVTESRSLFLSRDIPAIIIKDNKKSLLVRKKFETYKINQMRGI